MKRQSSCPGRLVRFTQNRGFGERYETLHFFPPLFFHPELGTVGLGRRGHPPWGGTAFGPRIRRPEMLCIGTEQKYFAIEHYRHVKYAHERTGNKSAAKHSRWSGGDQEKANSSEESTRA